MGAGRGRGLESRDDLEGSETRKKMHAQQQDARRRPRAGRLASEGEGRRSGRRRARLAVALLLCWGLVVPPAGAAVDVTLDAPTIQELLNGFMPAQVLYPLFGNRAVTLNLSDVRVLGFDPAGGRNGRGEILTSLRIEAPELRLSSPVQPRISLQVEQLEGERFCVVRFSDVELEVPVLGSLDISRVIRPVRIPADVIYPAEGGRGEVNVRTRLVDVTMGTSAVRFRFDVTVSPAPAANP